MSMKESTEQRQTQMRRGVYSVVITGPEGLCLDVKLDMAKREPVTGSFDDAMLQELLVVTSVVGGLVEGEMHRVQAEAKERGGVA